MQIESFEKIKDVKNEVKFKGYIEVIEKTFRFKLFSGSWSELVSRTIVKRNNSAAVLLYNKYNKTVILVEQLRIAASEIENNDINSYWVLEPVAGMIDIGETAEETAKRESIEEANCKIEKLVLLQKYLVSSGFTTEVCYLFCGFINEKKLSSFAGLTEESEDIKIYEIPLEQAFKLVENKKLVSPTAIIGLQWLELQVLKGKFEELIS